MIWSHRLALLLSGATLVLILFGGLVTNTGAALAVPDWPTTFGHNMFLYPWSQMVGGVFYEHSHRLIGSLVGALTLLLAFSLWVTGSRRWLRWLGVGAVGFVSVQGLLGGLRVILLAEPLAIVHGALAQAFFGLTVALAFFTSREWFEEGPRAFADLSLRRLTLWATGSIYLQIVLGSFLTHRGWLGGHLGGALLLLVIVPALLARVLRCYPDHSRLTRPSIWLAALLGLQLCLGAGAYLARFTSIELPVGLGWPVAHRVLGGLLFAASLVLTLRVHRLPLATRVDLPVSVPGRSVASRGVTA
jgi:cytochrome c oxidase assembly protein subunit 15